MINSIIANQFIKGLSDNFLIRYQRIYGNKGQKQLNSIIPGVYQNLKESSETFIQALIKNDIEFIESVTVPSLKKVLVDDMNYLKKQGIEMTEKHRSKEEVLKAEKYDLSKIDLKTVEILPRIIVSPYVIFGQNMEERLQRQDQWDSLFKWTIARYINPPTLSNIPSWIKSIREKHVYGFDVYFRNPTLAIQIQKSNENLNMEIVAPELFLITFETDSQNTDFWISDFNLICRKKGQKSK